MNPQTANQINSPQVGQADIVPNTDEIIRSQQAMIDRLLGFRDAQGLDIVQLKAQLAAAQKACAEMRDGLNTIRDYVLNMCGPLAEMEVGSDVINAVLGIIDDNTLQTDFGKDWHSPAEWGELQAKCAEMRKLIHDLCMFKGEPCFGFTPKNKERVKHALSTSCGQGWRSPEEWAALEAKCAEMRNALILQSQGCDCQSLSGKAHRTDCKMAFAVNHALSTNIGSDFVPKAELKTAQKALRDAELRLGNWEVQHDLDAMTQQRDDLRTELANLEIKLDKLKEQVKPLVEALRFIHDECDWKEYDSDGDNRIGEACSQALAHAKQLGIEP